MTKKSASVSDLIVAAEAWPETWRPAALWVAMQNTKATRASYGDVTRQFAGLARVPMAEVVKLHVIGYKMLLVDAGRAPATIRHRITVLRSLFGWAKDEGYHPGPNPARGIPIPRPRRVASAVALDGGQVGDLLDAAGSARDRALLALMADGGLRAGEVVALRRADFTTDGGQPIARVLDGKGAQARKVPLTARARDLVLVYLGGNTRQDGLGRPLFQARGGGPVSTRQLARVVAETAAAAGLGALSPHDLRRTFATRLLAAGAPAPEVQRAMGHQHLTTTAGYYLHGHAGRPLAEYLEGETGS